MVIELLGTRIIGPFYGVGLIVWSSLISVTLMALAVGYYSGGMLADRNHMIRLSHIIFVAALFTGVIPLISEPVQSAADFLGMRAGALLSAMALFFLPLALLGMVGPYAIKIVSYRLDNIGSTAGSVYAISTVGSVLGTLILGFYLLPAVGSRAIILGASLLLLGLAFCLSIYEKRRLHLAGSVIRWAVACLLAAVAIVGISHAGSQKSYPDRTVVSDTESHFGWVRVVDDTRTGIRWLMADSSVIGGEELKTGRGMLGYQQLVKQIPLFNPKGTEALLIGLGAGHLVEDLSRQGIRTDSIEIDPEVASAAQRHFNFKPSGELLVGDGRYHVRKRNKKYDFIIHDCFTGGAEPIHLLSLEMLLQLKDLLKPEGILVLNFVGFTEGPERQAVNAVARTLDQVFSDRRSFVSAPGEVFNDFIFFAANRPLQIASERRETKIENWLAYHEYFVSGENGFLITDDFNPLESLQVGKAERYREVLIERMGREILFW